MAHEQKRLFFQAEEGDTYIDIAAALSASNRKQYHQMKRDGTPLCYSFTIRSVGKSNIKTAIVSSMAPTWTTRNAAKMAAVGWKKQLKHAGVRIRDLPTYGKSCRVALEPAGTAEITLTSGKKVQGLAGNYVPQNSTGASLFTSYIDAAGDTISYDSANTIVTLAITDATGTTTDQNMVMRGAAGGDFGVVDEYLGSRRQQDTLDEDTPGPSSTNKMTSLFSTAEEMSDDIIEAVSDYADNRPYNIADADDLHFIGEFGIVLDPGVVLGQTYAQPQLTSTISGVAPLGLLKVLGFGVNDEFVLDVHSIYEM